MSSSRFLSLLLFFSLFSCTSNKVKDNDEISNKEFIEPEFFLLTETNLLNPFGSMQRMLDAWNREAIENAKEGGKDSATIIQLKDTTSDKNRSLALDVPFMYYNDQKSFEEVIKNASSSFSKWRKPTATQAQGIDSLKSFDFNGYGILVITSYLNSQITNSIRVLPKSDNNISLTLNSRASSMTSEASDYTSNFWKSDIYKINKLHADSLTIYFTNNNNQKDSLQYSLK